MTEFLEMGGYARFVWPAYGVAVLVLLVMALVSLRSRRPGEALEWIGANLCFLPAEIKHETLRSAPRRQARGSLVYAQKIGNTNIDSFGCSGECP